MPRITLSSKNQITLPVDIVRILDLKPGDKLVAELIDDHIVLLPQPESWTDYFGESMRGVYGSTVKEIDKYILRREPVQNGGSGGSNLKTWWPRMKTFAYQRRSSGRLLTASVLLTKFRIIRPLTCVE